MISRPAAKLTPRPRKPERQSLPPRRARGIGALNLSARPRDKNPMRHPGASGDLSVKSIRPDHQAPLAGAATRQSPGPGRSLGKITLRFVALLALAILALAFAWHR